MTSNPLREFVNNLDGELGKFLDDLPEPKCALPVRLQDPDYQNDDRAWNNYLLNQGDDYNPTPWMQDRS
ncbi:MAG TPA: hypothetical protein VJB90_05295 [Candidatus Nanoarchaeia archaeon]|nr:hypothetical protein [Candidatus Nanoarchaeia archaeon]